MKSYIYTLLFCLVGAAGQLHAQTDNIFHDREFWKENPTLEQVKEKVAQGNSPTALTIHGFDAIVYAILEKAPIDIIKYLLTQGNGVNKITHDARTYIFWAAYKGNVKLMEYLLDQGAKTDIIDQHGYSILMFAAATGQTEKGVYELCIAHGADIFKEKDKQGRNALLAYASSMKNTDMLDYFVSKGLDIHYVDNNGNGVFFQAAKTGDKEIIESLLDKYKVNTAINKETNENAILFASRRFSRSSAETPVSFYQYLESLGNDPAIVSKKNNTALQNIAYNSKNIELFEYLLSKGADANIANEEGDVPLMIASYGNNADVIKLLISKTDNINHTNNEGITALNNAIKYHDTEVSKLLIDSGADVKVKDKKGNDLGYYLVDDFRKDVDLAKKKMNLLVSNGYNPKQVQYEGKTLLHLAIDKQSVPLVEYMLTLGLDINAKDDNGNTPLHLAAMTAKNDKLMRYLVKNGADVNIKTSFDETVKDLASENEILTKDKVDVDFLSAAGK